MTTELKPCPFCNQRLYIRKSANPYGRCETKGCWMHEAKLTVPLDDAVQVSAFNTRAVLDVPDVPKLSSTKVDVCKGHAGIAVYVNDERIYGPSHNGIMKTLASHIIEDKLIKYENYVPLAPNCGRYLAISNNNKMFYLNHMREWQGCENFIDRNDTEIKRLRQALEPFASYGEDHFDRDHKGNMLPDGESVGWVYLSFGDFRKARAVLEGSKI